MMLFLLCFFIPYFILFLFYAFYQKARKHPSNPSRKPISILIPLRNEEEHLNALFQDLISQKYPNDSFPIIFWNDASTDRSRVLIESFIDSNQDIQAELINEELQIGKKKIITKAVDRITSEWILLCDADTQFGPDRLNSFAQCINDELDLIIGKVTLKGESFFQKLQALEYDTMMAIAQATTNMGDPILGSSANLMFRTEAFRKAKPYQDNPNTASGDDVFLINSLKKLRKNNVTHLSEASAQVYSKAHDSLSKALAQRIRWAGKNPNIKDFRYQLSAWASLLCNVALLIMLAITVFDKSGYFILLLSFSIKLIAELLLFIRMKKSEGIKLIHFLTLNLIYPLYVTLVGLLSFVIRPRWK